MNRAAGVLSVWLEGIGAWAPELPDWQAMGAWLDGAALPDGTAPARPAPGVLSPAERRRAPFNVRMALDVAGQAITMSGRDAATTPSLFASAHGDADILDYVCATLAEAPAELSPTRFHNSVHNAAAGYWTMATGCHAASNALTALDFSFASGLLEAASVTLAEHTPMLFVASDGAGQGPISECVASRVPFACALLLAAEPGPRTLAGLTLRLEAAQPAVPPDPDWHELYDGNLAARGLPLLAALAQGTAADLRLPAAPRLDLVLTTAAWDGPAAALSEPGQARRAAGCRPAPGDAAGPAAAAHAKSRKS